jgi:hypothetical protein
LYELKRKVREKLDCYYWPCCFLTDRQRERQVGRQTEERLWAHVVTVAMSDPQTSTNTNINGAAKGPQKIAVVGSGVTGLLIAQGLQKVGGGDPPSMTWQTRVVLMIGISSTRMASK